MGSPASERCREPYGKKETEHRVTLTHSFEMAATETTRAQFQALMGYLPGPDPGWPHPPCTLPACPVGVLTWQRAAAYCNALSAKKGLEPCYTCTGAGPSTACGVSSKFGGSEIYNCPGYRFPTEAEWEYAYRAGTRTALYNGPLLPQLGCHGPDTNADKIAWYEENSSMQVHPVGQKQPNDWGLHDMAGNVFEYCNDWFQNDLGVAPSVDPAGPSSPQDPDGRIVIRGGTAISSAALLRAAIRDDYTSDASAGEHVGFRCTRSLP